MDDIIVFYRRSSNSMVAVPARKRMQNPGEIAILLDIDKIWETSFPPQHLLSYVSSPIHSSAFIYMVTRDPNHLHRISLDSGERTIMSLRVRQSNTDREIFEIPGTLWDSAPPILVSDKNSEYNRMIFGNTHVMCVVGSEGTYFIELSDDPCADCLTAYRFNPPSSQVYKPVHVNRNLVATAVDEPCLFFLDLRCYPQIVSPVKVHFNHSLFREAGISETLSETVFTAASGQEEPQMVAWFALNREKRQSWFLKFKFPQTVHIKEFPYPFEVDHEISKLKSPMLFINGSGWFISQKEGNSYLSSVHEDASKPSETGETPLPKGCSLMEAVPLNNQYIVAACENKLVTILTTSKNCEEKAQIYGQPLIRPVTGPDILVVQTSSSVLAYSF